MHYQGHVIAKRQFEQTEHNIADWFGGYRRYLSVRQTKQQPHNKQICVCVLKIRWPRIDRLFNLRFGIHSFFLSVIHTYLRRHCQPIARNIHMILWFCTMSFYLFLFPQPHMLLFIIFVFDLRPLNLKSIICAPQANMSNKWNLLCRSFSTDFAHSVEQIKFFFD